MQLDQLKRSRLTKIFFSDRTVDMMQNLSELTKNISKKLGLNDEQLPLTLSHIPKIDIDDNYDCTLIKGDNITALTALWECRSSCIDFCYIDPPYNTGSNFIYSDRRKNHDGTMWGIHSQWMKFMLPRLVLMKTVLKSTGIAAVSIDDYEYPQLKIMMDNIFGEDHHLGTLIVNRSKNGKGGKSHVAPNHEYVLIYGRSKQAKMRGLPETDSGSYDKADGHGRFKIDGLFRKKGDASKRSDRPNMYYPLFYNENGEVFTENITGKMPFVFPVDSKGVERRWLWGAEKAKEESWRLFASSNGVIYVKNYYTPGKRVKVRSIWDKPGYLTDKATNEISAIFGEKVFETPKPLALIEDLIDCCASENSVILDFFAGTGTTAHAADNLNKRDGGSRRVILAEQSEPIPLDHVALQHGHKTISDITEYRLKKINLDTLSYSYCVINFE